MKKENTIWSNNYDWVKSIVNDLILEEEYKDFTEDEIYQEANDLLDMYHSDLVTETKGLTPYGVIGIADLGFWNGRRVGYSEYNDLSDVFYGDYGTMTFGFIRNDLHSELIHHDGTHFVKYRAWKKDTTEEQKQGLLNDIYKGEVPNWKISRYTEAIKPLVMDSGIL